MLLKDDSPRNEWPLARVIEVFPDVDNYVRKVRLALSAPIDKKGKRMGDARILERPIHKIVVLVEGSSY